jgi:hypothetical protein
MRKDMTFAGMLLVSAVCVGYAGDTAAGAGRLLKGSVSTGVEYSDNRDSVAHDREDSLDLFMKGRVAIVANGPRTVLDLSYSPSVLYRTNPSDVQNDSDLYHSLALSLEHRPIQRLKLALVDHFDFTDDPAMDEGGNVIQRDSSFILNKLDVSSAYECSRQVGCKLSGYHLIKRYDVDSIAAQRDEDSVGGAASASYTVDRDLVVAVVGGSGAFSYGTGDDDSRDYTSYEVGVDVSRRYGAKMKADLAAGWKILDYSAGELGTDGSPYVRAGLVFAPSPRTSFDGTAGYLLRDSDFDRFASQRFLSADLGARWIALTQRLTLRAGCGYRIGFYDTDTLLASDSRFEEDVEQTTWTASLGATWRIRKIYDVVISQGYDHVGYSDDAAESYTRNATRLSVGRDF